MGWRKAATVLFYPSEEVEGRYVAHCLDFDLIGTGDSPRRAFRELLAVLEIQIETWMDLGKRAVPPTRAPKVYWDALDQALKLPEFDITPILDKIADRKIADRKIGRRRLPNRCEGALLEDRHLLAAAAG